MYAPDRHGPVVLGVDDDPDPTDAVLRLAADAARLRQVSLRLAHGCQDLRPHLDPVVAAPDEQRAWGRRLAAVAVRLERLSTTVPPVELDASAGTGVEMLLRAAPTAALVVVLRNPYPISRAITAGSSSTPVASQAESPVLVVRTDHAARAPGGDIVVGVDRAEADAILATAFHEAQLRQARIVAVRAWHVVRRNDLDHQDVDRVTTGSSAERAQVELAAALAPWIRQYPDVRVDQKVVRAAPDHALVAAAQHAALLVVGRHRRSPFGGARLGRTARLCVDLARCPVLITPGSTESAAPASAYVDPAALARP
jgi:nucleotide-binding universal stress UspA family protein